MSILAVMEQASAAWHKTSWETLAAAQQLGSSLGLPVFAAVPGNGVGALAEELASKKLDAVHAIDHPLLGEYTADGYTAALEQLIRQHQPQYVLFPHTYQVRDFAPKLATRFGQVLVSDVVQIRAEGGSVSLVRQLFQGKLSSDVSFGGKPPYFASIQAGSYRPDGVIAGNQPAPVKPTPVDLNAEQIRTRPEPPFRESERAVDLSASEIIVSVGRGIKEKENISMVEDLARALGGDVAASRPICDNGWLPMERQVGSSGQTVAPKLYVAVGISGAIQHLVGMKGAKNILAINKDPEAPIFEIADYGVVGDLFEIVPALTDALKKAKA